MTASRFCSKTACGRPAVATLTYVYSDSTCVLGPLAVYAEPHSYDLCALHAERMTPPVGWDIVRLDVNLDGPVAIEDPSDDLLAVVEAVREHPIRPGARPAAARPRVTEEHVTETARKRHLRVLRDDGQS